MNKPVLTHAYIQDQIAKFLENKKDGNWHEDKSDKKDTHQHGADLIMVGGIRNSERFIIECKSKSYAPSAGSQNKEGWLNALGQLVTRMNVKRINKSKTNGKSSINRAYKYGLGLCWESAQVALRRIPKEIATTLNLHVFSVNDEGIVKQFTPSKFGKDYSDEEF